MALQGDRMFERKTSFLLFYFDLDESLIHDRKVSFKD